MDNEVSGEGNSYDYGFRIYSPRIGRWFSVDPLFAKMPGWSTYKSFLDSPISYVDPEGGTEFLVIVLVSQETGKKIVLRKAVSNDLESSRFNRHKPELEGGEYQETEWYDYSRVYTVTFNNGEIVSTSNKKVVHDKKPVTVTYFDAEWFAKGKLAIFEDDFTGDGGTQNGGWQLFSDEGGAMPTKYQAKAQEKKNLQADAIDVGDLVIVLGALGSGLSMTGKELELPSDVGQNITDVLSLIEKTLEIPDAVGTDVERLQEAVKYVKCTFSTSDGHTCGDTIPAADTSKGRHAGPFTPVKKK